MILEVFSDLNDSIILQTAAPHSLHHGRSLGFAVDSAD